MKTNLKNATALSVSVARTIFMFHHYNCFQLVERSLHQVRSQAYSQVQSKDIPSNGLAGKDLLYNLLSVLSMHFSHKNRIVFIIDQIWKWLCCIPLIFIELY